MVTTTSSVGPPTLTAAPGLPEILAHYADPPDGVRANMITSLDGAAAFGGRAGPLSDAVDQQLLLGLRGFADVILVGAGTVRAESYGPVRLDPAQLEFRRAQWGQEQLPPIAVITRTGNLPQSLFSEPTQPPLLLTSEAAVQAGGLDRASNHAEVVVVGRDTVDVAAAVTALQTRGLRRILCEGGPSLLDELVVNDLIDDMCLTVAPKLAGSQLPGRPLSVGLRAPVELSLRHALSHDGYLYLRYTR